MSRLNHPVDNMTVADHIDLWWDGLDSKTRATLAVRLDIPENSWAWGNDEWAKIIAYREAN
jgi:hypothetical protein